MNKTGFKMGFKTLLCATTVAAWPLLTAPRANAAPTPKVNNQSGPQFAPCTRTAVIYNGRRGFLLSNGKTEAVIVPQLGRVMSYGFVGGENQLWNAPDALIASAKPNEWRNYGGDKSWPSPQDYWPVLSGTGGWPPDKAWDGSPHSVQLIANGLRTLSPVSPFSGARCVRDYGFNGKGDFVVSQLFEKLRGAPVMMSIWSITQVPHPEAMYVRRNPKSPYQSGFHGYGKLPAEFDTQALDNDLLRLKPSSKDSFKVGLDSPVARVVSLRQGVLFSLRANKPEGNYPDGAAGAGFPVEIYNNPAPTAYEELELLGPIQQYKSGNRFRHTVTWSLRRVADGEDAAQLAAQLLK